MSELPLAAGAFDRNRDRALSQDLGSDLTAQLLATVPGNPLAGLARADRLWSHLRTGGGDPPAEVVQPSSTGPAALDWDVVVCGGTLGIFVAVALAARGWRVAIVERGALQGRDQEWNISRRELAVLSELGLVSEAELAGAIATEFNPVRVSFAGGPDYWLRDVLNLGVSPARLIACLKEKFLALGGKIFEGAIVETVSIAAEGAIVRARRGPAATGAGGQGGAAAFGSESFAGGEPLELSTRLVLDALGHGSPIARQLRGAAAPDGVCLVVGTCATGLPACDWGDLLVSTGGIVNQQQPFWEAFPASGGRTTYRFVYVDAHPSRPSLRDLFNDYFRELPAYQGCESWAGVKIQRALFGVFPSYRASPWRPGVDRLLPIGDSSGLQSPLSFGGFGALLRHLGRLVGGLDAALAADALDATSLGELMPELPSLSVTWLFQRAMRVGVEQTLPPDRINRLLNAVFGQMAAAGEGVLRPFVQDVVQFPALSQTLARVAIAHPILVAQLVPQLGLPALVDWLGHYGRLGVYDLLDRLATGPLAEGLATQWLRSGDIAPQGYRHRALGQRWQRWREAWHYGSGRDYLKEEERRK